MKQNYFLMFFIILGVQLLICNYFHISPYITLSLLPCIILLLIRFEGLGDHLPAIFRRELREQCHSEIRAAFADASGYVADLCKCTFPTLLNVLFHFQQP